MPRKLYHKHSNNSALPYFQIGDEIIEIIKLLKEKGKFVSNQKVFDQYISDKKYSARTVRDMYEISSHYPKEIRNRYSRLTFHHFRTALKLNKENPYEILDWCQNQEESHGGQPAPVDEAIKHFNVSKVSHKNLIRTRKYLSKVEIPIKFQDRWSQLIRSIDELFTEILNADVKICHIYQLVDPINNEVFYIGKTELPLQQRLKNHLSDKQEHTPKYQRILLIQMKGYEPEIQNLEDVPSYLAEEAELKWIKNAQQKGIPLTNLADTYIR